MRCMVVFCKNKGNIPGMTYFMLTSRRHDSWMRALGRDPSKEHLTDKNCICHVHFREEDKYVVNNKYRLRPDAIPRLSLRKPFLPTFQTINRSFSQSDGVHEAIKPEVQSVELVPKPSCQQPDGYLSGHTTSSSQMEDITNSLTEKGNNGGKVFCRMCLEPIPERNKMVPLTLTDLNFAKESTIFKKKKAVETYKISHMIQIVLPDFDFNAVYNPIVCNKCVVRLTSAYNFMENCRENEIFIQLYKSKHCPNEQLLSCEDVALKKSLVMEKIPPVKKLKISKKDDSIEPVNGGLLEQMGNTGLASDISQAECNEIVNTRNSASQENFNPETSLEPCSYIKCESKDTEDYGGDSHFLVQTEEMSCRVKEEIVVEADVSCDLIGTPNNERKARQDMHYPLKGEAYLQTVALRMSTNDDYF